MIDRAISLIDKTDNIKSELTHYDTKIENAGTKSKTVQRHHTKLSDGHKQLKTMFMSLKHLNTTDDSQI